MAIIWTKLIPRWGGDTIEPPEAKKDTGYIAGDKPPAKWENWLRKGTYEALDETRDVIEGIDSQLAQIEPHLNKLVTDTDGVHGLKVESGIWTPTLAGGAVAGVNTYAEQNGKYYRIGNMIICNFGLILSSKDASMSGNIRIRGLPFAIANEVSGTFSRIGGFTFASGYTQLNLYGLANEIILNTYGSSLSESIAITAEQVSSTAYIYGSIVYNI